MTAEYVSPLFCALDSLGMGDARPAARARHARIADLTGESTTATLQPSRNAPT
jgi:hypothetical protein